MPNHITNILVISGDEAEVKKCLAEIKAEEEGYVRFIDFNTFIPIPKELVGTRSPTKFISQAEYDAQEARIANNELTDIEKDWGISRGITKAMSQDYIKRFGADNWYDWQLHNWGTKWNAYDQVFNEASNTITFDTAWSTPQEAMIHLSKKYPTLTFKVEFADEDLGHNVGKYTLTGGEIVDGFYPEGGSQEAYAMAMTIKGDQDYYLEQYLCEDADEGSNFTNALIELAHKEQYMVDEYPVFVLEKLKELALADEQYERVKGLDDLLKAKAEGKVE
jgi:hypothetical protein